MIYKIFNLPEVYEKIKKGLLKHQGMIVIYATYTVDSICTCKILSRLFSSDNLKYKIIPVSSYEDLKSHLVPSESAPCFILLINCGSRLDLSSLQSSLSPSTLVLLDAARPLHHSTVHAGKRVIVLDDGGVDLNEVPTEEEVARWKGAPSDDEDYEDDEELHQGPEDELKEQLFDQGEHNEKEEHELEDEDEEEIEFGKKRGARKMRDIQRRKEEREAKRNISKLIPERKYDSYYEGTHYATASSVIAYNMAKQMRQETGDLLWLYILGLTEMYTTKKYSEAQYISAYNECQKDIQMVYKNPNKLNKTVYDEKEDATYYLETNRMIKGTIIISNELNAFMLRHSNLYDALYYSNYLIVKLKLMRDDGYKDLDKLIVRSGIPLAEAKQKFHYMKSSYKRTILTKLSQEASNMGYSEMIVNSFVRQVDEEMQYSAIDFVNIMTAVLESPSSISNALVKGISGGDEGIKSEKQQIYERVVYSEDNFWNVYHDILGNNEEYVSLGLELSIKYQQSIVAEARRIITEKLVKTCTIFRYVILKSEHFGSKFNVSYLSILKIANLLMEIYSNAGRDKPLAICVLDVLTSTYTVIGVMGNADSSSKNVFGNIFKEAADQAQVRHSRSYFDGSMIKIHKDDFGRFMEKLLELQDPQETN